MSRLFPTALVLGLAVLWIGFVGSLAVARQDNLRTNAFDLGYIAQTLWNTAHGEPFRLTVLEGASFRPEGLDPSRVRRPHSYLAFHVEPIDLPLAAIYALWPDPRRLLWLQAVVVGLGALPAAWLGARLVGGWSAGLAFGAAWLLAPGLEGAALSDFHAVALGATFLMTGLWLLESGRYRTAWALLMLAALTREDAALAVTCLGVVLGVRASNPLSLWERAGVRAARTRQAHRTSSNPHPHPLPEGEGTGRQLVGEAMLRLSDRSVRALAIAVPAALWTGACVAVIAPYFNGGGSLFWSRYAWLGATPGRAALSVLLDPRPLVAWVASPDVAAYLGIQLLTGGLLAVLAPIELLAAGPLLALNALSSFDWMRSGGAHYSALLVPLLLWAAAHGAQRALSFWKRSPSPLTGWEGRPVSPLSLWGRHPANPLSLWERVRVRAPHKIPSLLASALVLLTALAAHLWIGASPLRPGFAFPDPDPRAAAVLEALRALPSDVPASASSALYPHLASRHRLYWFPALQDAEWIAVDVAGTSHPLTPVEMRDRVVDLLASGDWGVAAARDGLLVLRRGAVGEMPGNLFVAAVRAPANDPEAGRPADLAARVQSVLPDAFYGFARVARQPAQAGFQTVRFGGALELVDARLHRWPQVGLSGDAAVLETHWRALTPIAGELRFALAVTRRSDGALIGLQPDLAAAPLWYPTTRWQVGETIRLEMPVDGLADVQALGVAVLGAGDQPLAASGPVVWQNGTIARVAVVR